MRLAEHAVFWIVSVLLGLICFVRAFRSRERGFDDAGATRDTIKLNVLRLWAGLGVCFILFPLLDMLSFFRLMPD